MFSKFGVYVNGLPSIVVTLLGMMILAKAVQCLNAEYAIVVKLLGDSNVTLAKLMHTAKAKLPIVVTLFGIVMEVIVVKL
jgi:hypothetical protein